VDAGPELRQESDDGRDGGGDPVRNSKGQFIKGQPSR
jgi:hypothetical protein